MASSTDVLKVSQEIDFTKIGLIQALTSYLGLKSAGGIIIVGASATDPQTAPHLILANDGGISTVSDSSGGLKLTSTSSTGVIIDCNLRVTGTGTIDGRDVSADGASLDSHLLDKGNPHDTTVDQVLAKTGGTVAGALTVNNLLTAKDISVAGTVDGRDVSADGARLDSHLLDKGNPHDTTVDQVLAKTGGTVAGALTVNNLLTAKDISVAGTVDGRDVSADGARLDSHLLDKGNPHDTTVDQVLAKTGGTVAGALTVNNLLTAKDISVAGTVDGRDVSADGARLDSHLLDKGNPHDTTVDQVLAKTGGTVAGALTVNNLLTAKDISVAGTVDGRDVSADGARLDSHLLDKGNPHGTTVDQVLALTSGVISGGLTLTGQITAASPTGSGALAVQRAPDGPIIVLGDYYDVGNNPFAGPSYYRAISIKKPQAPFAVMQGIWIDPDFDWFHDIWGRTSFSGGGVWFNCPAHFKTVDFANGKPGYVVDRFVNRSGTVLRTGDVVRLKGSLPVRCDGNLSRIPILRSPWPIAKTTRRWSVSWTAKPPRARGGPSLQPTQRACHPYRTVARCTW